MEALSDGHTVAPLIKVAYLHARRGAKTYMFHFAYQTKETEYPQVSFVRAYSDFPDFSHCFSSRLTPLSKNK